MKKRYPIEARVTCSNCGTVLAVVFNNYFDKARRRYYCNEPTCKEVEKQHRGRRRVRDGKTRDYSAEIATKYEPPPISAPPTHIKIESDYYTVLKRHYQLAGRVSPASPRSLIDRW